MKSHLPQGIEMHRDSKRVNSQGPKVPEKSASTSIPESPGCWNEFFSSISKALEISMGVALFKIV